ncbi:hypothetical protein ACSVIJ_04905 [Pseudomonas sp. NCHU5208]|uniref:hypothetical protein n=1 Tax=unclassified Pseudomonas TaxID=196821 RepID=UPI003F9C756A
MSDFADKSRAWIKGRSAAIIWGDDWEAEAGCPYEVGTLEASEWDAGLQAGLDEMAAEV